MKKYTLILILFFLCNCSKKDVFEIPEIDTNVYFIETIGGSKNDAFNAVTKTIDDGYITAGYTQSNDGDIISKANISFDFLVSKFSSENILEWQKHFGGSKDDKALDIIQTLEGDFIILGSSESSDLDVSENAGSKDFWLVKFSNNGILLWEKSFGFLGEDYGTTLLETKDGGFLITGVLDVSASNGQGNAKSTITNHAGGDYWVLKTNHLGALEWSRYFGGSFTEIPLGIVETDNHNYIIVGSSDSNDFNISNNKGSYDFWMVRVASNGDKLWTKSLGGSEIDQGYGITKTEDGNYIVVGDTRSTDGDVSALSGNADAWVVKFSPSGAIIWEKTYGEAAFDSAKSIIGLQNGNFAIVGNTRSSMDGFMNRGQNDAWVFIIDTNGNLKFNYIIGGSSLDFANAILETQDNKLLIVGSTESNDIDIPENKGSQDALLIKIK